MYSVVPLTSNYGRESLDCNAPTYPLLPLVTQGVIFCWESIIDRNYISSFRSPIWHDDFHMYQE